jgi:hypothetical protein
MKNTGFQNSSQIQIDATFPPHSSGNVVTSSEQPTHDQIDAPINRLTTRFKKGKKIMKDRLQIHHQRRNHDNRFTRCLCPSHVPAECSPENPIEASDSRSY